MLFDFNSNLRRVLKDKNQRFFHSTSPQPVSRSLSRVRIALQNMVVLLLALTIVISLNSDLGRAAAEQKSKPLDVNPSAQPQEDEEATAFNPISSSGVHLSCRHLKVIVQSFSQLHLRYDGKSDTDRKLIEERAAEQFIKRLDPTKIYFYESDVKDIKSKLKGILSLSMLGSEKEDAKSDSQDPSNNANKEKSKAKDGQRVHHPSLFLDQCDPIMEAYNLFLKRVEERAEFAKKKLENAKFKFDKNITLVLDPEHRKYPKNKKEAENYQAKYLQFQLANVMAAVEKEPDARPQLIRTYDRALKKLKDTKEEEIFAMFLDSVGRSHDPHTSFMSRDVLEDFQIQMSLSLEGIGASLSSQDGFTVVEQLIPGGAAKESGLVQVQDKIIAVGQMKNDGTPGEMEVITDMDLRDVVRRIRGQAGSKVRLTLLRKTQNGPQRMTVTLVRSKIKLEEEAARLSFIDREIKGEKKKFAVIDLPAFYAEARVGGRSSAADMKALVHKATEAKADGLILDLTNNSGGSLPDAVKIAGLFFKKGNVVKQSSREPKESESVLADTDSAVDWAGPLVVLTNRFSASASEIVAGTLKDYQRAVIVGGDHTYGKGSVQMVVDLPASLGALKVTVGMFFTPGGFSTQHRGVEGDIILPNAYATDDVGEKSLDYSLPPKKLQAFLSPEAFVTEGSSAWAKISAPVIEQLKKKSTVRVAQSDEFKKILADLKKNKEQLSKPVKLADSLKDNKERKDEFDQKKNLSPEDKLKEYLKRPEVQEGANVLADLIEIQSANIKK